MSLNEAVVEDAALTWFGELGSVKHAERENIQMRAVIAVFFSLVMLLASPSHASIIDIGEIIFVGDFTLDHTFNFNIPGGTYGSFEVLTVNTATGIFAPHVAAGDTLGMDSPMLDLDQLLRWTIGGFLLETQPFSTSITGADSGRLVSGVPSLSGNGFDPSDYPFNAFSRWSFTAPPHDIGNFHADITGPIQLRVTTRYDDRVVSVPEPSSLFLFGVGVAVALRSRRIFRCSM